MIQKWTFSLLSFYLGLYLVSCTGSDTSGRIRPGGWITYWDFAQGMDMISRQPAILNDVFFFVVHLDIDGTPVLVNPDLSYAQAINKVKANKGFPWMTVVNDVKSANGDKTILKDPQVIHQILTSSKQRESHRKQIVHLAVTYGFSGVDIDYENLWAADRDLFTMFIRELAIDLRENGILLSVTVQPKLQESLSDGPGAADWANLCQAADRLQIMLYNLHSNKTSPGPMATPRWITAILHFAKKRCNPERIVPILKVSGMNWGPNGVEGIQYDQAVALAQQYGAQIRRDSEGNVPYFLYNVNGKQYTVYYEDIHSLKEKISVLRSLGYGSVVFWSLGRQDPALLSFLVTLTEDKTNR